MSYLKNNIPKMSIVIPVYNAEKYIERCLESILNQTYRNFEVILVDDGSKDGSLKKLYDYKKKDRRIKVFTQKNSGPSVARNKGIKESSGEYLIFIDIDDYIEKNYLDNLMRETLEEYDLVTTGYIDISKYGTFRLNDFCKENNILECIFNGVGGTLWGKRFKKSIITNKKIRLNPDIYMCEDQLFVLEYVLNSTKFKCLEYSEYCYNRLNEESLSSKLDLDYHENLKLYLSKLEEVLLNYKVDNQLKDKILNKKTEAIYLSLITKIYMNKKYSAFEKINNLRFLSDENRIQNQKVLNSVILKKLKAKKIYRLHYLLLKSNFERVLKDFIKFKIIGRSR